MRRRRRLLVAMLLLILLPLSCYVLAPTWGGVPLGGAAVAQLHARLNTCSHQGSPIWGSFQSTVRPLPDGFVVVYSSDCSIDDGLPVTEWRYTIYRKAGLFWLPWSGGGGHTSRKPGGPVSASASSGFDSDPNNDYSIIFGQVLVQQPLTLEGQFGDGSVLQETVADDLFALILPKRTVPCELRARDANGAVVFRQDLHIVRPAMHNEQGDNCPP